MADNVTCSRWCFVPICQNTDKNTPGKIFLSVPSNPSVRKHWWIAARRQFPMSKAHIYCCEDHFNLKEDMENYLYYTMMGGRIRIKPGVRPHKFDCQGKVTPHNENRDRLQKKRKVLAILSSKEKIMEPDQRTKSLKRKFGPSTSKCSVEVYPSVVTKKTKLSEHRSIHQLPESAKEVIDSDSFEFIEVTKHYSDYDMLEKERMKVKVEDCSDHNMLEEERMKVEIEDCSDEKLEEEWIKVKVEDCSDEDVIVKVEHDIDEDDKSERANKFVSDKNKNLYGTGCGPPSPDIKPDEPEPNPNYNDTDNWLKVCPSHGHSRQCLQPALQCLLKIPSTANKLNVQWSREAELLLIEKVRCTECLWDHRDAMFLKKTFKRHQYERIASQIEEEFPTLQGLSADAVMHKWAMLKKTFIRELGKVKQPKNSSETTSKWHLFEVLLFLTNTTSAGPSICNFSEQTASKSNFQSIPESLEENEVINGTSLVYSGTEECNGTAKLHDTSSEGFSPLPEVSSCSPRASGGKEQQSSGKNDGATPSKDLHPSSAPKKRRLQSNSETATPSTDKAIALLEGAVHRSKERNSQAFGLYQIIDEHFKKISAKKQLILTAKIVNSLLEDDTQYEND